VVPNILASADPGELFVIRNIASLVPPCDDPNDASVPAAVAYAVDNLGVSDIVVCGHSGCGGIKALLAGRQPDTCLGRWLSYAQPALDAFHGRTPMDDSRPENDQLSQLCALHQMQHLLTYPSVRSGINAGKLNLHAWWFDIAPGELLAYASEENRFVPALQLLSQRADQETSRHVA
jgi:carbonic anhydrase